MKTVEDLLIKQHAGPLFTKIFKACCPGTGKLFGSFATLEPLQRIRINQQPQVAIGLPVGWI